jgi:hypothetical protein
VIIGLGAAVGGRLREGALRSQQQDSAGQQGAFELWCSLHCVFSWYLKTASGVGPLIKILKVARKERQRGMHHNVAEYEHMSIFRAL